MSSRNYYIPVPLCQSQSGHNTDSNFTDSATPEEYRLKSQIPFKMTIVQSIDAYLANQENEKPILKHFLKNFQSNYFRNKKSLQEINDMEFFTHFLEKIDYNLRLKGLAKQSSKQKSRVKFIDSTQNLIKVQPKTTQIKRKQYSKDSQTRLEFQIKQKVEINKIKRKKIYLKDSKKDYMSKSFILNKPTPIITKNKRKLQKIDKPHNSFQFDISQSGIPSAKLMKRESLNFNKTYNQRQFTNFSPNRGSSFKSDKNLFRHSSIVKQNRKPKKQLFTRTQNARNLRKKGSKYSINNNLNQTNFIFVDYNQKSIDNSRHKY